ncbi:REP element-mobilizing transposase RayT [Tangfeifania diversioriginum]|uniref:REP element-mobilizing transposase RayT n=1 Tax=Tangfeifania diversioriginum TaxID=1168035 RepID=A0A1M6I123_9BACT|nr:IS200/IS605 family transposase [Tangfeifania diversioriginum]SHJ28147.1 REP element-mobilizing transposase RayT [Tangfeifania diversioriginum]
MSYVRIWIHAVWGTKERIPHFAGPVKNKVFDHIRKNAKEKGIFLFEISGHNEHVHCLISLTAEQTMAKVMQLLKGESSYWINKQKVVPGEFEWADEYFAVSVSESQVGRVRQYIRNQEEHHRKKSWGEEVDEFLNNYGFERMPG